MVIKKGKSAQVTFVFRPDDNNCRQVALAGTFNDWQPDQGRMTRQKDGSFRKRVKLEPGTHRYKFLVDGRWIEDPDAEHRVPNQFGTCDALVNVG